MSDPSVPPEAEEKSISSSACGEARRAEPAVDPEHWAKFWFCEECLLYFLEACPAHGPPVFVRDTPVSPGVPGRAALTLPAGLEVRRDGAEADIICCADQSFQKGALFGPYQGRITAPEEPAGPHSWMIIAADDSFKYIDGSDEATANWMRFVGVSADEAERNLSAFQRGEHIYFRLQRRLRLGEKLRVWFSSDYMRRVTRLSTGRRVSPEQPAGPVLRSAVQGRRSLSKHGADEAESQPPLKKKKIDLIFKDVLEASLDTKQRQNNAARPRADACHGDSKECVFSAGTKCVKVEEAEVEGTLSGAEPSTSFCPNCVKLRRRIRELEAELLHLRRQSSEAGEPGRTEDVKEAVVATGLEDEDPDVDSADELAPVSDEAVKACSVSGRRIRRFKQEWLKKFWFLRYSPTLNEMWCHVCRQYTVQSSRTSAFIVGSKQFKIHTIKLHSQSNLHKKCLQLYKLRMHPEKTEEMCRHMTTLFHAAYHLAVEGRPLSDLRPLAELLKKCELKVVDQYLNESDCRVFVQHMARAFKEDLAEKIRLSPFLSVIIDGPSDDLLTDTIAVYVRFTTAEGLPATEFLSVERLRGPSVEGYLQALEHAFSALGLRLQDRVVVGLGIDGSDVPSGLRSSIYCAVRRSSPWVLCLPVMIRCPHVEVLNAINGKDLSCLEDLENSLKQLLGFYRYSPRLLSELRAKAPDLAEETEFVGDVRAVRWIIGEPRVLKALVGGYVEVVSHLRSVSGQSQRGDAAAIALSLLQFLLDYQSVKLVHFLLDVTAVFSRLAVVFQEDSASVWQVDVGIEEAVRELGRLSVSPGEHLQEFEEHFRDSFNGVDLRNLRVAESKFQSIREKICQRSQGLLSQRLDPRSRGLVRACRALDLTSWPLRREDLDAYGEQEVLVLLEHLETLPPSVRELLQERVDPRGSLALEWRDLKADYCAVTGFKELLSHVCRHRQRFPLLHQLLQLVRVLPASATCCTRGRASLQKVPPRLGLDQINDLLTLAVNGPPIGLFDAKRALDSWFEEKSGSSFPVPADVLSKMSGSEHKSVLHSVDINSEFFPDV